MNEEDYDLFCDLFKAEATRFGTEIWAYCLLPNGVHLILVPHELDSLSRTIGETRRRYTTFINTRSRSHGHLWERRYESVALDENWLLTSYQYVADRPVCAGLVEDALDWTWSSTRALCQGQTDGIVNVGPTLRRTGDFSRFLNARADKERSYIRLEMAERTGRPIGTEQWLKDLEEKYGQDILPKRPGRKKRPIQIVRRPVSNEIRPLFRVPG